MDRKPPDGDSALRRQLNRLLANARENEEKQRRLDALEFDLIATTSLGELVQRTADELLESKNFGMTSLNEVREKLAQYGLTLRGD